MAMVPIDLTSPDADDPCWNDDNPLSPGSSDSDEPYPTTLSLGINRQYVRRWSRTDAFREFYQNWKDAIIESFDLEPRSFAPRWRDTPNETQITVHRSVASDGGGLSAELLGYIRFDKEEGSLELTNFNARLKMHHLNLGGTSKFDSQKFAGKHGEGFKLAALVMHRNDHSIRISSSSYYWNFGFRGKYDDKFYCRLSPASPASIEKKKALVERSDNAGPRKELASYIWNDVSVKIFKGKGQSAIGVEEQDFLSWTAIAIDLSSLGPDAIIRTDHGDLVLDNKFAGRVYLKGLYVAGGNPGGKIYVFGYNFAQGEINRDRERLSNQMQEAAMVAQIWEQAILRKKGKDLIRRYIKLFHDDPDCGDIAFAERLISKNMAEAIFDLLKMDAPLAFFYSDQELDGSEQVKIITTNIKRQPTHIPGNLWELLRRYSLIQTPQEKRLRLFMSAEATNPPEDLFSSSILRMLMATFLLDQRLAEIKIQIVKGGDIGIDVLYKESEGCLLIHEKWFDFEETHHESSCDRFLLSLESNAKTAEFSCDHVVEDLIYLAVNEIRAPLKLEYYEVTAILRAARERVRQTPRGIRTFGTPKLDGLEVRWIGNEGGVVAEMYAPGILYDVTLHKESSCQGCYKELLNLSDDTASTMNSCNCPRRIVSRSKCRATFNGLDRDETYFPMVARRGERTFFGSPPAPVPPRAAVRKAPDTEGRAADRNAEESESANARDQDDTSCADASVNEEKEREAKAARSSIPLLWQRDEDAWRAWHEEQLPKISTLLFHSRYEQPHGKLQPLGPHLGFTLPCPRLGCVFEKGVYARIRQASQDSREYVALIQGAYICRHRCHTSPIHLSVTKFSFLDSEPMFQSLNPPSGSNTEDTKRRELLLHFASYSSMGTGVDAGLIAVDDIIEAQILPPEFKVMYCDKAPKDNIGDMNPFCRFARTVDDERIVFMPVASGLLPHQDPQKPAYLTVPFPPYVFDLTPGILGPLEGFSETGCKTFAGIGFDEARHITWRARNPTCHVFDGPIESVLSDFTSGKLRPPDSPPPGHPRIAIIAGENSNFRLSPENKETQSLEEFLRPLDIVDSVLSSYLNPDFTVLQIPPASLHNSAIGRLGKSILRYLERGQNVRISLLAHHHCGIPQARNTLVIIGSPFRTLLVTTKNQTRNTTAHRHPGLAQPIRNYIGDLSVENPRVRPDTQKGFVCSVSGAQRNEHGKALGYIYNHRTGQSVNKEDAAVLDLDANEVAITGRRPRWLTHPGREDLLTVRELARLQGFKDDFIFYGSLKSQYKDVQAAQPAAVARQIAHFIHTVAVCSRNVDLLGFQVSGTPKRARTVDDG